MKPIARETIVSKLFLSLAATILRYYDLESDYSIDSYEDNERKMDYSWQVASQSINPVD